MSKGLKTPLDHLFGEPGTDDQIRLEAIAMRRAIALEEAAERRRYELLRAAVAVYCSQSNSLSPVESVDDAAEMLAEIEKREGAEKL